jgi:uncharacterized membrane protein YfcA
VTSVEPLTLVLLVALIALAAFVNGTIGFGFALLAVNALALVLDAKTGVIAMSVITPVVSGMQVVHHRTHRPPTRRLASLLVAGLVGSAIGAQVLVSLPATAISLALGVFTIWFAVRSLRAEPLPIGGARERWLGPVAGLIGGISNGALGASGPIFGSYLAAIGLRGREFAFAISIVFFSMSMVRVGVLAALDQFTTTLVLIGLALTVPSILAQSLGLWFQGRVPARTLFRGVLVVLLLAGLNLLVRAAWAIVGPPA